MFHIRFGLFAAAAIIGVSSSASAVVTGITRTGNVLNSVTVERGGVPYTYTTAELIGVNVTNYNSAGTSTALLVQDGGAVPPPGSRATLLEDNRLDTGLINHEIMVDGATGAFSEVQFLSPVVNSVGADIILLEYDPVGDPNDPLRVFINGINQTINRDAILTPGNPIASDVYGSGTMINDLSMLESAAFAKASDTNQSIYGYSIDLSLFGIAPGASVTSFEFGSVTTGQEIDPVYIAGLPSVIPEPMTATLLAAASLIMMKRRRRFA